MENRTINDYFEIVAFFNSGMNPPIYFALFLLIYLVGLLGNIIIIICVITNVRLHTPMYIFLSNLSTVDMMFTSSTLPKLMDILLTRNNSISYVECITQVWFYMFAVCTEDMLLSFMAYDRYVAICKPLYYHMIMSKRNYILFLMAIWMFTLVNALFVILTLYPIDICHSNKIYHFFCEIKALGRLLCVNTKLNFIILTEVMAFGLFLFLLNLTSYIKIISVVLRIPSTSGRKKAFSTCTSHLTVMSMFYVAVMGMYLNPSSEQLEEQDLVFSVLFMAVTPMLNPIIYSLRNTEVRSTIKFIISIK
ncbi:hypothetical protein GDO81_017658 [Engystomops pustulosus]|uniref:G-protein coupled receptors family 1 profile domain-containing protein n=1 Tax=Engystomops pustulosus TaxID=76066 RepID=A0AAV6Z5Y5_ENGPU|nr:hypothetical protein GDO81_026319 [Engystomops pustulosus]KAG8555303.1 hypothetical protein GDO81_017658 [Engystomops pustulosus]